MDLIQIKAIENDSKAAYLEKLEGFERDYDLSCGLPLARQFPETASFRMSDDFPDQIALYDFLPNTSDVLVLTEKARAVLDAEGVEHVEYLPVQIINHKGRKVKERYFILNPFPLVDCADAKKTKYRRNAIDKEVWMDVRKLTIDDGRIPPDLQLFGVTHILGLLLVRRALGAKLREAGLRGFEMVELSDYRS